MKSGSDGFSEGSDTNATPITSGPALAAESAMSGDRDALRELIGRVGPRWGLSPSAINAFAFHAELSTWRPGEAILSSTGGHGRVHLLVAGAAKLTCRWPAAAPLVVGIMRPGRFFGLASLYDPPSPRLFTVIAYLDCVVAAVSHRVATGIFASLSPAGAFRALAYSWRAQSSVLYHKCRNLASPLRDRLLAELQTLGVDFGTPDPRGCLIDLPLTCTDLAEIVAASTTEVSHTLEGLQQEGLVDLAGERLVLVASTSEQAGEFPLAGPHLQGPRDTRGVTP